MTTFRDIANDAELLHLRSQVQRMKKQLAQQAKRLQESSLPYRQLAQAHEDARFLLMLETAHMLASRRECREQYSIPERRWNRARRLIKFARANYLHDLLSDRLDAAYNDLKAHPKALYRPVTTTAAKRRHFGNDLQKNRHYQTGKPTVGEGQSRVGQRDRRQEIEQRHARMEARR